jgi:hypothetical protein
VLHEKYIELLVTAVTKYNCFIGKCVARHFVDEREVDENCILETDEAQTYDWREYYLRCLADNLNNIAVWNKIYHRSLFAALRFGDMRLYEDNVFTPKVIYEARENRMVKIQDCLYYYRISPNSLFNKKNDDWIMHYLKAYQLLKDFLDGINENSISDVACGSMLHYYIKIIENEIAMSNADVCQRLLNDFATVETPKHLYELVPNIFPISVQSHTDKVKWVKQLTNFPVILYGYGDFGKKVKEYLEHMGVNIVAVWDKTTTPMKKGYAQETLILITILSRPGSLIAEIELRKLGYKNFMSAQQLELIIKNNLLGSEKI